MANETSRVEAALSELVTRRPVTVAELDAIVAGERVRRPVVDVAFPDSDVLRSSGF